MGFESLRLRNARLSEQDRAWLKHVYPLYVHELSAYDEKNYYLDERGIWQPDLIPYWMAEVCCHPMLVVDGTEPIGFALVGQKPFPYRVTDAEFRLAEFFVLAARRRRGVGQAAMGLLLTTFPGTWELSVLPRNEPALAFWRHLLRRREEFQESSGSILMKFDSATVRKEPRPAPPPPPPPSTADSKESGVFAAVAPGAAPDTRSHLKEIEIATSPGRAFAALVTPSSIRAWWGASRAVVVAELGGGYGVAWGDDEDSPEVATTATFVVFKPPRRFVLGGFKYLARTGPLPFEADLTTEFIVGPAPTGCRVRVRQSGFPLSRKADAYYAQCDKGWDETLASLKRYLEEPRRDASPGEGA